MNHSTAPTTAAHITGWDRAVVITLGAAGSALSYDALQQMAVAIHVRGILTYLFPLVVDGFIAYGVRALLVLRTAPLRARLYVWTLFGTATAASIWANALHAVRLNDETAAAGGLRLGDPVVAVLSTLAPLALAGAVHLYILIARGPAGDSDRFRPGQGERTTVTRTERAGQHQQPTGRVTPGQPPTPLSGTAGQDADRPRRPMATPATGMAPQDNGRSVSAAPGTVPESDRQRPLSGSPDQGGQPDGTAADALHPVTRRPAGDRADTHRPATDRPRRTSGDRKPEPDNTEALLEIARKAVKAQDKLTRKVVAEAIRGQEIPLSNDRLTDLMVRLRETSGQQTEDCLT